MVALAGQRQVQKERQQLRVAHLKSRTTSDEHFFAACRAMGFQGESVCYEDFPGPEKASDILRTRGIDGILASWLRIPWPDDAIHRFGWDHFAVVALNRRSGIKGFDLVRHSSFDFMRTALEVLMEKGERRILAVLHTSSSRIDDLARVGAVLALKEVHRDAGGDIGCLRLQRGPEGADLPRLIAALKRRPRPDCVLFDHHFLVSLLCNHGHGKLLAAHRYAAAMTADSTPEGLPAISGCPEAADFRYKKAMQRLFENMRTGRRGLSSVPQEQVVEPAWVDRASLGEFGVAGG